MTNAETSCPGGPQTAEIEKNNMQISRKKTSCLFRLFVQVVALRRHG
jgi:hypothetical protein